MDKINELNNFVETLKLIDNASSDKVVSSRTLIKKIKNIICEILGNQISVTDNDIDNIRNETNALLDDTEIDFNSNITTSEHIELFQLDGSLSDVRLDFVENSIMPPERGAIVQKLWKVKFTDDTTGYMIVSDTTDEDFSRLVNAQMSVALQTAPNGSVEDLGITLKMSELNQIVKTSGSRDLTGHFVGLEKPGLTARQLQDINIDNDPTLESLTPEQKTNIKNAANTLNQATTENERDIAQSNLETESKAAGLFSTTIGPVANGNYCDLKRFNVEKEDNTIVTVTASMPVITWGPEITGIPLRDANGPKDKTNRKDDGMSYVVDLGGMDPAIRRGPANPLDAKQFYNYGPNGATETEGALDRYSGGKCLGINTSQSEVTIRAVHKESKKNADDVISSSRNDEIDVSVPPMSALWKIDRATFDLSNSHAYYTVFGASRPPPAGYMGVPWTPKQNKLGRGRGEFASGVTSANGQSLTGKTFNVQNESGAILTDGVEVDAELKGLTSRGDNGHAFDPKDLLKFLQDNSFVKGTQYLTIPADATLESIEDVLIPAGQWVPQITQAVATLMQFGNGKYMQDGGPSRFQPGLIPFLPGTPAYTPEWHINWIFYNCSNQEVDIDGDKFPVTVHDVAKDGTPGSWTKPSHNASFGLPPPDSENSKESGYSPEHPETFDPVQLRGGIKGADCREYIDNIEGSVEGEISLGMLNQLEEDNKIFFTEAPSGAVRGWAKFLVVNCPLPVIVTINVSVNTDSSPNTDIGSGSNNSNPECAICACDRDAANVEINGELNPVWVDANKVDTTNNRLKFKVGDRVVVSATTSTEHGVALRLSNVTSSVPESSITTIETLETVNAELVQKTEEFITIHNKIDANDSQNNIVNDFIAVSDNQLVFHGGMPIIFRQKARNNPVNPPSIIIDFTIKEELIGTNGHTVACTVHGSTMSFKFDVCP